MTDHRTSACAQHGHREFTIQLEPFASLPLHEWLTGYFERSVARGVTFQPGQTVRFGWSTLRLCDRADGTIGVEERVRTPEERWTESVDNALRATYLQREVTASFGFDLDATLHEMQDAMLHRCALEGDDMLLMRLAGDELPKTFSGWSLSCAADHDHGEPVILPLLGVAAQRPVLVQFFALPPGSTVLVQYRPIDGKLRVSPTVFHAGKPLVPRSGSYVAALQG